VAAPRIGRIPHFCSVSACAVKRPALCHWTPRLAAMRMALTRLLNPVIVRLAGRRHVRFAAQIHHTGRRSGRGYVTPASARLAGDTFIIPLTFGNGSDWSRNVRAAGGCTIRLNGIDYRAVQPRFVDREQAMQAGRPAFNRVERIMFRGARHQAVPAPPVRRLTGG
jgi:deazaflavin-dependent oxidoreductase (nitroreductase family)